MISAGWRSVWVIERRAISPTWASSVVTPAPPRGSAGRRSSAVELVAGLGQEDVVERRRVQLEVLDPDALGVERAHDRARARRRRARAAPRPRRPARRAARRSARARSPGGRSRRVGRDDLEARAADLGLQRLGRALGHDPALVDDARRGRPARRPPRGTAWSASRSRRPRARAATTSSHRSDAALRVEAGGRLVEEEDARASARARAPGRAGASCRPSSRRPCGRPRRPGRRARAARRRGATRSRFGSPCSVVCRRRCSRPVSSGSSAASWSAAPIASRTWAPSRTMS